MFAMLTTVISLPVSGLAIGTANAAEPLRVEQGLSSVLAIAWSKSGEAHAGIPPSSSRAVWWGAVQSAGHSAVANPKCARRLGVGKSKHIDSHECGWEVVGEAGDRRTSSTELIVDSGEATFRSGSISGS